VIVALVKAHMEFQSIMKEYPRIKKIIIIGAGIGGLSTGNLLAGKGHKVTIFESHSTPGGYTAGFNRKGFYFESGTVNLEQSASVFMAMKKIGVLDKIKFEKLKTRFVSEEFDGIPEDYEAYKQMIRSGFPSSREMLDPAFSELDKFIGAMGNMDAPMPFMYTGINKIKSVLPYILGGLKMIKLVKRYGDMPSSEFASRYFSKGSKLHRLFMGFSYPDMPAIAVGGSILSLFKDVWTVKDGMQSWADILSENFRKSGGELKLNSYVDRIITKKGAAAGVICKNTVYDADYVISAGDYKKTFLNLLDNKDLLPRAVRDNIAGAAVSEGYFTVYLGLNMTNEELGGFLKAPHIFVCGRDPGYDIYDSEDEEFFNRTSFSIYSPSLVNARLAPEGKSSVMLQAMAPYRWMNNWGGQDRQAYRMLKEKAMKAVIDGASRLIPGLADRIEYKDAATPLTYERFTHNTGGATSAWSWNPRKKFYGNGLSVHVETPVKRLYIGSCWAMQIGGVPGAIGAAFQCAGRIK
jgi:phytoene dehydrogenase-like protein